MGLEFSFLIMGIGLKVNGKMEKDMEGLLCFGRMEQGGNLSGKMESIMVNRLNFTKMEEG